MIFGRRHRNKTYWRLGRRGELQWGRLSRSLVLWWHGRRYIIVGRR